MKRFLILITIAALTYKGYEIYSTQAIEPLFEKPYIAVYGRDSCGFTRATLDELKKSGIQYHYFQVDSPDVANQLHARMESSGIDTRHYYLPVVDLNSRLEVRPDNNELITKAKELNL